MYSIKKLTADIWRIRRRTNKELVRRLIERLEPPDASGLELKRYGTDYGGWWLPVEHAKRGAVYYGVGVGLDISYDLHLARDLGMDVYLFDPTPMAMRYYEGLGNTDENVTYVAKGLWDKDEMITFYEPRDPRAPSHSVYDLGGTSKGVDAEVCTLPTLMKELGHERVDILKIDIEGSWNKVIDGMKPGDPLPFVLQVEFDSPTSLGKVRASIRKLKSLGYRFVHREKDNYLFLRDRGQG